MKIPKHLLYVIMKSLKYSLFILISGDIVVYIIFYQIIYETEGNANYYTF